MPASAAASPPGGRAAPRRAARATAALAAAAALVVSAALLAALYLPTQMSHYPAGGGSAPLRIQGAGLAARLGRGESTAEGGLRVKAAAPGADRRALFTRRVGLQADAYPVLEYHLRGQPANTFVYFVWRTAQNPGETYFLPLHRGRGGAPAMLLAGHPHWHGSIVEVGVDIYGNTPSAPLTLDSLTLRPATALGLLRTIWTEWTSFQAWTQSSAHTLHGAEYSTAPPVTLAAACWAGLALLLVVIASRLIRRRWPLALVAAVAVPWIAVDLLWQLRLSQQLDATRQQFGGLTQEQRHLVDYDSDLFAWAQGLVREVLPAPGSGRIFLLQDEDNRTYRRLRLQYFLLPHNVYNYGRLPPWKPLRRGDIIITLGQVPGLEFDPGQRRLLWRSHQLPVEILRRDAMGAVYRVRGRRG